MKNQLNYNALFIIIISICFVSIGCNNFKTEKTKTPEELRNELKIQEERNPMQYITLEAKMHDSIIKTREAGWFHDAEFGKDGSVIKGLIKNTASVAKFKDVVLNVTYYSATQTEIKNEEYIFYEFYEPNSTRPFTIYVHPPEVMKSFNVTVKTATPIY